MEAKEPRGENPFKPVNLILYIYAMTNLLKIYRSGNGFSVQSIPSGLIALLRSS